MSIKTDELMAMVESLPVDIKTKLIEKIHRYFKNSSIVNPISFAICFNSTGEISRPA